MGIFSKKSASADAEASQKEVVTAVLPAATRRAVALKSVIRKPRITEKAAVLSDKNVYTFEIAPQATKYDVRDAIKALYNVTPVKVNIVSKRPRRYHSSSRGRTLLAHGMRVAYVYLKKDDRIELV